MLAFVQMFLKPPHKGLGTAFHQDNGCTQPCTIARNRVCNCSVRSNCEMYSDFGISDPLKGTGMWIAVDPATEENGTMRIVPKTHLEPTLKHRRCATTHHALTHSLPGSTACRCNKCNCLVRCRE
jgi:ectoine hydroxylase-related dioxygenase (phytanoyl-CoA dioxygenase family)